MKRLSDYKGEEALELWGDLIDPISVIITNENVRKVIKSNQPRMMIAKVILQENKKEAEEVLLRIDDTPIDGLNILVRLVGLLADIGQNDSIKSFFGSAEQKKTESESTGSPTENTEVAEN